ncbi:MAG: proteasome activator [Acidimicrobiales bacterium]
MTDPQSQPEAAGAPEERPEVAHGELVEPRADGAAAVAPLEGPVEADGRREAVEEPAKLMRIGSMVKQLLDEVRSAGLDAPARTRLKDIYDQSVREVGSALSPDLREELERMAIPFGEDGEPSDAELRIAQAQLVGWLEGLFHGIQASLFAQQMAARGQLEDPRRQLPAGGGDPSGSGGGPPGESSSHGTYL